MEIKVYRRVIYLLLIPLLYCGEVIGQTTILEGIVLSIDEKPVIGATIEYTKGKGTNTDVEGVFRVELDRKGIYDLKIRSLGYEEKDTLINLTEGKNYLVVTLKDKSYSQPEVLITEKINSIFKENKWQVLDFKIHNRRIFVLYFREGKPYLGLSSIGGAKLDEIKLEGKYRTLYESCSERLYLKGKNGLIEISENKGKLMLLGNPISLLDYKKYMLPCVDKVQAKYIFKSYTDHNKRLQYFDYDNEKKPNLIYEIFDEASYEVAKSYYEDIIKLYYRSVNNPKENAIDEGAERINLLEAEGWNGDLIELIVNNELHFAVSYYQNIESRELDAYDFKHDDDFYILDMLSKNVIKYINTSRELKKIDIDPGLNWQELNNILMDKKSSKVYLSSGKKELYELEVKDEQIGLKKMKDLEKSWPQIKGLEIYDGIVYYCYQPNSTKLETVILKESLERD